MKCKIIDGEINIFVVDGFVVVVVVVIVDVAVAVDDDDDDVAPNQK